MEKYGFVYLWYDCKNKRYYLGRHWGTESDGYICSSKSMREAHRRRPNDFRRRIVKRIHTSIEDLIVEEQRWLSMIEPSECGKKYYNKTLKSTTPSTRGYKHSINTIEKIRRNNKGKVRSEETRQKISKAVIEKMTEEHRKNLSEKVKLLWKNEDYVKKIQESRKKIILSDDVRKMRSDNMKRINSSRWNKKEG